MCFPVNFAKFREHLFTEHLWATASKVSYSFLYIAIFYLFYIFYLSALTFPCVRYARTRVLLTRIFRIYT